MKSLRMLLSASALALATHAGATPVVFSFDTVVRSGNHSNGLGATGGSSAIATYMNGVLSSSGIAATVAVSGALATATYDGEDHVSGNTLGPDAFIINDNFGIYGSASDSFTLAFNNFTITSISFDWEIFPNAQCPWNSTCRQQGQANSNWPDMSLHVDGASVWAVKAPVPGNGVDPQGLGTASLNLAAAGYTLTFVDWPAEVGIDNLVINGCVGHATNCDGGGRAGGTVPEPSTCALLALAFAAGGWTLRRRAVVRI